MIRRPPSSPRPDPRCPSPTLFRSPNGEADIPGQVAFSRGNVDNPAGGLQSVIDVDKDGRLAGTLSSSFADPTVPLVSAVVRSEEHTSELQSLMRISYAVFCLHKQAPKALTDAHPISHHRNRS